MVDGHKKLTTDPFLHSQLVQLGTQGFLERKVLGDCEASLLGLLNKLGITYAQTDAQIEIDSVLDLINLESIQARLNENPLLDSFQWSDPVYSSLLSSEFIELDPKSQLNG